MNKEMVKKKIEQHTQKLRALGVDHLYVYGSAARNKMTADSDLDFFFDYHDPGFSFVQLVRIQNLLADIFHRKIDVTSREGLHPALRAQIVSSAERVF